MCCDSPHTFIFVKCIDGWMTAHVVGQDENFWNFLVKPSLSFAWSSVNEEGSRYNRGSIRNDVKYLLAIADPGEFDDLLRIIGPEVKKQGIEQKVVATNGQAPPYKYAVYHETLIVCPTN